MHGWPPAQCRVGRAPLPRPREPAMPRASSDRAFWGHHAELEGEWKAYSYTLNMCFPGASCSWLCG